MSRKQVKIAVGLLLVSFLQVDNCFGKVAEKDDGMKYFYGFTVTLTYGTSFTSYSTEWTSEQPRSTEANAPLMKYVVANYDALEREIAQGQGKYVEGLVWLLECPEISIEEAKRAASLLQPDFDRLVPKTRSPDVLLANIRQYLKRADARYERCKYIS